MNRYYDFSWTRDGRVVEVHVEWAGHVRPADYRQVWRGELTRQGVPARIWGALGREVGPEDEIDLVGHAHHGDFTIIAFDIGPALPMDAYVADLDADLDGFEPGHEFEF